MRSAPRYGECAQGPGLAALPSTATGRPEMAAFAPAVGMLRDHGVRLAIDDMGTSFASLRHIVNLAPDITKCASGGPSVAISGAKAAD